MNQRRCALYGIRAKGTKYVKVGVTSAPSCRMAELQAGCPHELTLEFVQWYRTRQEALAEESLLHTELRDLHVRGEWFEIPTCHKLAAYQGSNRTTT